MKDKYSELNHEEEKINKNPTLDDAIHVIVFIDALSNLFSFSFINILL